MRGTAILAVSGQPLYGLVAQVEGGVRFKVVSREWDGLELVPGQVVGVRVPGQPERQLLVASVTPLDEFCWVYFTRPLRGTPARRSSATRPPARPVSSPIDQPGTDAEVPGGW